MLKCNRCEKPTAEHNVWKYCARCFKRVSAMLNEQEEREAIRATLTKGAQTSPGQYDAATVFSNMNQMVTTAQIKAELDNLNKHADAIAAETKPKRRRNASK